MSDLFIEITDVNKTNPCHVPSGPKGGQFCSTSTGSSTGDVATGGGSVEEAWRDFEQKPSPQSRVNLWVVHPINGLIFSPKNLSDPIHTEWFSRVGLPTAGPTFDRLPRGTVRFSQKRGEEVINITSYRRATPSGVVERALQALPRNVREKYVTEEKVVGSIFKTISKTNPCHVPSGPKGGEFCSIGGGTSGKAANIPVAPALMAEKNFKEAYAFVRENYGELITDRIKGINKRNFVPGSKANDTLAVTHVIFGGKQVSIDIREKQSSKSYVDTLVHELTHVKQSGAPGGLQGGSATVAGSNYAAYREGKYEKEAWAAGSTAAKKFTDAGKTTQGVGKAGVEFLEYGQDGCPFAWDLALILDLKKINPCHTPSGPHGGEVCATGSAAPKGSVRSERAKSAYVPATAERQRAADHSEKKLAEGLGFARTGDNSPFDLVGPKVGVEVKTMFDSKNSKITMNKEALARKLKASRKLKVKAYTVVVDNRGAEPAYLYRKGVGSFRLSTMKKADSLEHLQQVLTGGKK